MANCSTDCDCATNAVELDFTAPVLDMRGIKVGRTVQFRIYFKYPKTRLPYDITADDFEMAILDSALSEVENLQVGSGFTITAPNILDGVITPLTTGMAGKYTFEIIWTIAATGATPTAADGKIIVKA